MNSPVREIDFVCRICAYHGNCALHAAREMMYGSREVFDYVHCAECGCLQIADIPQDLARHYPADYYSQLGRTEPALPASVKGLLMRWMSTTQALAPDGVLAALQRRFLPMPGDFAEFGDYLVGARLRHAGERILDVGCGASPHRLAAMQRCGFDAVEGIDPFIAADTVYHGVPVRKCTIADLSGNFGLVMFHHSLEHVPDPVASLRDAARLLRPGGTCLVRVPVMGTYFWRHFGVDWAEIDAPRHLQLLSLEAIGRLATRTGFSVRATTFDSEPWELQHSLRHQRGIASREDDPSPLPDVAVAKQEQATQRKLIDQLNRLGDAGRACFYLEKIA